MSGLDPNLDALLWNGRATDVQGSEKIYGVVPAIVIAIDDDREQRHRMGAVKIRFPFLLDEGALGDVTPWARCVSLAAGLGAGFVATPQVGDEVLVGFENGDVNRPYVLGGLYNPTEADGGEGGDGAEGGSGGAQGGAGGDAAGGGAAGGDAAGADDAAGGDADGDAAGGGDAASEQDEPAHDQPYEVRAEVVDGDGRPVASARYEVKSASGAVVGAGSTDGQGLLQVGVESAGSYEVRILSAGGDGDADAGGSAPAAASPSAQQAAGEEPAGGEVDAQQAGADAPAEDLAAADGDAPADAPPAEDDAPPAEEEEAAPAEAPADDVAEYLVAAGRAGRGFVQRDQSRYPGRIHAGQDIPGPRGTAVHAAMAGQVLFSGRKTGYGNLVIIKHPRVNCTTAYAHLDTRMVEAGATVQGGQQIGTMGNTADGPAGSRGRVRSGMGVHLHFSVQRIPAGMDDGAIGRRFGSSHEERQDIRLEPRAWLAEHGIAMIRGQ